MKPERLARAKRALFDAMGQIAIVERMLAGLDEPGQWGQGRRGITIVDPERPQHYDVRLDVAQELRTMSARLEQIDDRVDEVMKPSTASPDVEVP